MKIYTKTGDKGETSLFDGTRVKKSSNRIESYGSVDEINSHIGMLLSLMSSKSNLSDVVEDLFIIQNQLFTLGSDLANPRQNLDNYPRITEREVTFLENCMDKFDKELKPLKAFILPGGTVEASQCHVIRTVTRRSEIKAVDIYLNNEISKECFVYINRLSDLFFILARVCNRRQGQEDIMWKK
ncbi:cob(I)yrinic acid a,c-diamide adenosyltransferase [Candidatus Nitrosocosmicus arcticus]|uniref:Cob(I)alamin adenosyltransferase n=1 Tax=Candidatus Nitrosocosmicus arcticus TaxID=2035267 RepID=A0A557SYT9_9ARCH|nr:cob(I)yrinic acid a,c-diamide adenosyltransferase [Candidatus Nitrosocosmicus arcticus]TVP41753.1 Cob(I)alamin adenosyltransferase [Candidatus Nitrosocosmicus arcticus]